MRIVFIGTVMFSREMLIHLVAMGADVIGACAAASAVTNSDYADLGDICDRLHIPLLRTQDINSDETIAWILERRPDVVFCFGWSRLIGSRLLNLPRLGVVGYHPAALPQNRGRHPLIWALALGLERTASTFFLMDEGADSGDIISQVGIDINADDNASTLYEKVIVTAKAQLDDIVPKLVAETILRRSQDNEYATYWRKRTARDGRIDWRMSAEVICNLVRALSTPYPGADFETKTGMVKVWKARVVADAPPNAEPGKVIGLLADKPIVRCGIGAVCLLDTSPFIAPDLGDYL